MSKTRILLLGPPCAGKGTQAAKIVEALEVPHISTGDMLRAAVAAKTEVGLKAKALMAAGSLVGDDMVIGIARDRLGEPDAEKGFVLDGFPRTLGQAEALDRLLSELNTPLECCLAITVDTDAVVKRLLKRAQIEGRADDNEESIRERFNEYGAKTAPLLDYYSAQGLLAAIDGMGSVDEVNERIREVMG